jgi:predicted nucleic acid-binding protein
MIILDTNVLSEPMKRGANPAVAAWLDQQDIETLYLTTINLAELLLGVGMLPRSRRRSALEAKLSQIINLFAGSRILPFDAPAARLFAVLVARASSTGHIISFADGQIAAIAAAHGFSVATRDVAPFIAAGVPVVNPWDLN